jgi:hypothetical protein
MRNEKIRIWKEFLSPRFKSKFGLERNRINRGMRKCFNSELCDVWLVRKLHYAYCTISTLNTGDYGSSTYVSANKLQAFFSWHMTTEPQEDDVMANVFINFMLKYGKFSAPKAVLEGAMKEAQLACYEESPDKEDDGDFRVGFECLSKSNQLYPIWVFMNYEEGWEKKRENPHDKSVSYGCKTKWTSNMSSRRDGDLEVAVSEDGMKWYDKIATFIEELHKSPYVPALRRLYNKMAKEMGVLPVLKEAKTKKHMRRMEAREANGGKAKRVELTKLALHPKNFLDAP